MKIHYLFYFIGVIFIFATVWYFAGKFIATLPKEIKLTLLFASVITSFIIAEFLRSSEI